MMTNRLRVEDIFRFTTATSDIITTNVTRTLYIFAGFILIRKWLQQYVNKYCNSYIHISDSSINNKIYKYTCTFLVTYLFYLSAHALLMWWTQCALLSSSSARFVGWADRVLKFLSVPAVSFLRVLVGNTALQMRAQSYRRLSHVLAACSAARCTLLS